MHAEKISDVTLKLPMLFLSLLQAEHNIQKQMLKNLQQEHHNMQMNHNTGMWKLRWLPSRFRNLIWSHSGEIQSELSRVFPGIALIDKKQALKKNYIKGTACEEDECVLLSRGEKQQHRCNFPDIPQFWHRVLEDSRFWIVDIVKRKSLGRIADRRHRCDKRRGICINTLDCRV